MEFLKTVFGDKSMTFAELETALKDNKEIKLANLASGQYVDKSKFDGVSGELATANGTIQTLQDAVKKFDGVDVQKLKDDLAAAETKYNTDLSAVKRDNALDVALIKANAKSAKAVKAFLNLDEIKLDGDKLLGLDEQLEKVKSENDYLFGGESTVTASSGGEHSGELDGDTDKFISAAMQGAGISK